MINVSQHCKERYAERIMEKGSKIDINIFIAQQSEKIQKDISKMVEYGKLIYEGQTKDNKKCRVYLNDTWVLLTDSSGVTAITIYKIELGAGIEFDREYVHKMQGLLDKAVEESNSTSEVVNSELKEYKDKIRVNDEQIAEYKRYIKNLEELNASYKGVVSTLNIRKDIANIGVLDVINKMIGKLKF